MIKRVFYVVHFNDRDVQRCVDAIRLICDPNEKGCAHITVRGPYRQRYNVQAIARKIQGKTIDVDGVGSFFEEKQNTIFLKCSSPSLEEVWMKSDYGYNPHVTLYDGTSRKLATMLLDTLLRLDLKFSFIADGLTPFLSVKGQRALDLRSAFDCEFVSKLLGETINADMVDTLPLASRLAYVETLASHLPSLSRQLKASLTPPSD